MRCPTGCFTSQCSASRRSTAQGHPGDLCHHQAPDALIPSLAGRPENECGASACAPSSMPTACRSTSSPPSQPVSPAKAKPAKDKAKASVSGAGGCSRRAGATSESDREPPVSASGRARLRCSTRRAIAAPSRSDSECQVAGDLVEDLGATSAAGQLLSGHGMVLTPLPERPRRPSSGDAARASPSSAPRNPRRSRASPCSSPRAMPST